MSYYRHHLYFCTNVRDNNAKPCCSQKGSVEACQFAKQTVRKLGLSGKGGVRVSSSGCMGRCAEGPAVVIYPEQVWYTFQSLADVETIIQEHLVAGRVAEAFLMAEQ